MSEEYLKCACQQCGQPIAFPPAGLGAFVTCPHCGAATTLSLNAADDTAENPAVPSLLESASVPVEEPGSSGDDFPSDERTDASTAGPRWALRVTVVVMMILGSLAAAFLLKARFWPGKGGPPSLEVGGGMRRNGKGSASASTKELSPGARGGKPGGGQAQGAPGAPVATPAAAPAKSIEDLQVGAITLEKAKGSSLVYATGTLHNRSALQRFGLKIEVALVDGQGRSAGTAKDYRGVLEPGQDWPFRALVLDSRAVSGSLSSLREDE